MMNDNEAVKFVDLSDNIEFSAKQRLGLNQFERLNTDQLEEEKELNKESKDSLSNVKFALDELLLYFIFNKASNDGIRDNALNVLVKHFQQREEFLNEVVKIELIVSDKDKEEYKNIKFQHYRLTELIDQITHDDYYYWLYQIFNKDKTKISLNDITDILTDLINTLHTDDERLHKKQNMMRHLDIGNDLITNLMKKLYYKKEYHYTMYKEITNFLFMYCYKNPNNQRTMLKHLNYLVTLTDKNIQTPKLISQILINYKNTDYGMNFLQFLINKIITKN